MPKEREPIALQSIEIAVNDQINDGPEVKKSTAVKNKENSVIEFIDFMVRNRLVKDIDQLKKKVDKMKTKGNGLKEN